MTRILALLSLLGAPLFGQSFGACASNICSSTGAAVGIGTTTQQILPGAEVAERSVPVGEMQSKLLAKIEEITLHMIQEHESSARLERENRELRIRVLRLEERSKE